MTHHAGGLEDPERQIPLLFADGNAVAVAGEPSTEIS